MTIFVGTSTRMVSELRRWAVDTTALSGVVLVPSPVETEIERGRETYPDIPAVSAVEWAELVVPTEEEVWTALQVKAQMGGGPTEHLGECAVIACAHHRELTAIIDEETATAQAERLGSVSETHCGSSSRRTRSCSRATGRSRPRSSTIC